MAAPVWRRIVLGCTRFTRTKWNALCTCLLGVTLTGCVLYVYISRHIPQDDSVWEYLKRGVSSFREMGLGKTEKGQTNGKHSRTEHCNRCFAPWLRYETGPSHICRSGPDQPPGKPENTSLVDALIVVSSASGNRAQRQVIRDTWGKASKNNTAQVRVVFVLGRSYRADINRNVQRETKEFSDIVQGNFMDSYDNLTFNTITGVKYAVEMCSEARFFLKTDDDVWLNVPGLLDLLSRVELTNQIGGHCYHGEYPRRINRRSKWFVSYQEYPRDLYPNYCAGVGYVMPMPVVRGIYHASKDTPFFRMEDVYIGLCVEKMAYHVRQLPGFYTHRPKVDVCEMKMNHVITSHSWTVTEMRTLWMDGSDCSCPSYCRRTWLFLYCMTFVWITLLVAIFFHSRLSYPSSKA